VSAASLPPAISGLLEAYRPVHDLGASASILSWDQETMMPPGGREARGRLLGTLAGLRHQFLSSTAFADALAACESEQFEGAFATLVIEARRDHERATKIPARLTMALAEAESKGLADWQRARAADDFSIFRDSLACIVDLVGEKADCLADGRPRYDALLDLYEPNSTQAELEPLFAGLRAELAPLVQAAAQCGVQVDESYAQGRFDPAAQYAFGRETAAAIGFDFESGRLDLAAHPFCTGFDPGDVRLTWRHQEDDFRPALFGILHEMGHGLYEQGLPKDWQGSPLGSAVGLGVHESQSRLWENLVGRSAAFWTWLMPRFRAAFPAHPKFEVEQIFPALHTVRPSLIRVEADEATYNLHVAARFDLERRLFRGELSVDDLPEAWDASYQELLGVHAPSAADGVLQDIHWAMGAFGYFPTYTLGNLIAAQLFEAAEREISDLEACLGRGEFAPLLEWLRDRVHRHGKLHSADELVRGATGSALSPAAFLRSLRASAAQVYGV
jgi:carboxypeptidase Taq